MAIGNAGISGIGVTAGATVGSASVLLTGSRCAAYSLMVVGLDRNKCTTASMLLFVLVGICREGDIVKLLTAMRDRELGIRFADGLSQLGGGKASVTALAVPVLNITLRGAVGGSCRNSLRAVYVGGINRFGFTTILTGIKDVLRVTRICHTVIPMVILDRNKCATASMLLFVLLGICREGDIVKLLTAMRDRELGIRFADGLSQLGGGKASVTALAVPVLNITLRGAVGGSCRNSLRAVYVGGINRFGFTAILTGVQDVLRVIRIRHTVVPTVALGYNNGATASIDCFMRGLVD